MISGSSQLETFFKASPGGREYSKYRSPGFAMLTVSPFREVQLGEEWLGLVLGADRVPLSYTYNKVLSGLVRVSVRICPGFSGGGKLLARVSGNCDRGSRRGCPLRV